jgi:hypothetical protein
VRGRATGISRHRERCVLAAALDLAHDLCDSEGEESDAVTHARAEIQRLRTR